MSEIRLCPSILNADHSRLDEEIARVATGSDLLHLDIMDNIFVPNQTFSWEQAHQIIDSSPLPVDAHLMVQDPDFQAPRYAEVGCASVTFHYEAAANPLPIIKAIRSNGARVGLAVKPGTDFDLVRDLVSEIDMLLVMTVEPGFGGQSFMEEMMPKVAAAHAFIAALPAPHPWIQVDGGISPSTIAIAAKSGADTFVAGSAVFKSDDPLATLAELRSLALNAGA
jgi:ribulose-phosphate 3-epimerase